MASSPARAFGDQPPLALPAGVPVHLSASVAHGLQTTCSAALDAAMADRTIGELAAQQALAAGTKVELLPVDVAAGR